jgi:osmotically-inducible protein OsmY
MRDNDVDLCRRVRDIVAVIADDIDAVSYEVEDGIVYIEGVVSSDEQRHAISSAVTHLPGVEDIIECLATEHVMPVALNEEQSALVPPQVYMHYFSLS